MERRGPRGASTLELVSDLPGGSDGTWSCPRCLEVLNVRTSAIVRVTRNPRIVGGRIRRGSGMQVWACACCLARGVITRAE